MKRWPVTVSIPTGLTVGGIVTWATHLARAASSDGRRVRFVVHPNDSGHASIESLSLPSVEIVTAPALSDPLNWDACVRTYRSCLPSLMLPNNRAESFAVMAALATAQPDALRVVAWNHSYNPYDYACLSYYEPMIVAYAGVSRRCCDELQTQLPARSDAVSWIPYCVAAWGPVERRLLEGRPLRLIYGGRMEQAGKRVFDLLDLATRIDAAGVRFELLLIGDGPQAMELDQRIAALNHAFAVPGNSVQRHAPISPDRMQSAWSWADIALSASEWEGFSVSMIESMMCGCVPVMSRVASGIDDVVESGTNGLTFPIGDTERMAEAILELAADEKTLRRMSTQARERVMAHCSMALFDERVVSILRAAESSDDRSWPPDRAVHMNAQTTGTPTVPADARTRLQQALKSIAEVGRGPVAIYGAGHHTRALADVLAESPVPIAAIVDDDPSRHGSGLWGWPIIGPDEIRSRGAQSVVLSSWMHEDAMWKKRKGLEADGLRVVRLYAGA